MGTEADRHDRLSLTSRFLERDGEPWIPVSGEFHYSRVPRDRWSERLRLMRASGITVVASYVFWLHHEEARGDIRFDDSLDVAGFVQEAAAAGLEVVLRIGPWCHGEARNGGLPDWVVAACPATRRDDPVYLALVREWFTVLGRVLAPVCTPSGPVIGIQVENELYDQPEHLLTLKRTARAAGVRAPVWTATGWGGAQLPPGEVLPVFGGYSDGFWVDWDAAWDDTFREHFFFSHTWDDPGIGADQRAAEPAPALSTRPGTSFPAATCELGAGMATAYHRRPDPAAADAAAIANVKIGNGSVWQGFYMYAGGVNPAGADGTEESHRTGYPNDMPRFDYDFHAPIGASGRPSPGLAPLREHNLFVETFGPQLAGMSSVLPDALPDGVHDRSTLRWAVRSDGDRGFVFVNRHQPHEPLDDYEAARFRVATLSGPVILPDRPVTVPAGTIARWPFGLSVAGVTLDWATASALTVVNGPTPTLVFRAHRGIVPRARWAAGTVATSRSLGRLGAGPFDLPVGDPLHLTSPAGSLTVLVVDERTAAELWTVDGRLIRSTAPVWADEDGLRARSVRAPECLEWDTGRKGFARLAAHAPVEGRGAAIATTLIRPHSCPPDSYGSRAGRESAPTRQDIDRVAAVHRLSLPLSLQDHDRDSVLVVDWLGDVAQLRVDGAPVADRFWDGTRWELDVRSLGITAASQVTLHVVPLRDGARIGFAPPAREILARVSAPWCAVDGVRLEESVVWRLV